MHDIYSEINSPEPANDEIDNRLTVNHEHTTHYKSNNISIARDILSSLLCPLTLNATDIDAFNFRCSTLKLPSLQIGFIEYGTNTSMKFDKSVDCYTIMSTTKSIQISHQENQAVISDTENAIVISPKDPSRLEIRGESIERFVCVKRKSLELQLSKLLEREITESVIFDTSMSVRNELNDSWWRTVKYVQQEFDCPDTLYSNKSFIEQVEQMLISGLLFSQPHNYTDQLRMGKQIVLPSHVRRAEAFILKHIQEAITSDDIIAASAVPRRTLYAGFKRFLGISPMTYLHKTRMEGARQELLTSKVEDSITNVAMKWGFNHLGRFSTRYKSRFGESPSQTLKRTDRVLNACH